jgi:hypothetical protein
MTPYKRFVNPTYVKVFNYYLKTVVEKQFERKYHQEIKLKLYGISIQPKNSRYNTIPVDELTDQQTKVKFFIDTYPNKISTSTYLEELIFPKGTTFLQLKNGSFFENNSNKFIIDILFNKRPLYDLDYKSDNSLNGEQLNESQYDYQDSEEYYEKLDKILNKFLSNIGKEKDIPDFLGYRALTGKNHYGDFTVKLTGIFKKPFSPEDSDIIYTKKWNLIELVIKMFPFLKNATIYAGSTSTLDNYEHKLDLEKKYLNRKVKEDDVDDKLPFLQEEKNGIKTRLFKESTDNHELKWHFDKTDRKVKVVKSNGWELQMDNQLPIKLNEGDVITIPKGIYHRVIKGTGDLIVKIKEY